MIAGSFGVRGEVRLKSYCAEPSAIADYGPLETEDGRRRFDVTLTRPVKDGYAARMTGIATKEEADALRGTRLFAPRDRLPALEDDEYYFSDLIGLPVFDSGGVEIGKVKAVLENPGADLLELRLPGTSETALLPFTRAIVPTVDLAAGRIVADPPEGLLPDRG
ncbi:16S rRNA processing protein RimM [Palleronia sediminis]|uniref:Ribosome maturation factor RimM n=1 Tax=Palleronia sediminis TaxID=2547833 RepID=A0A4R6AFC0_9RHOB|nr:ribosome maturation factor RimM [Palleronia sediminis]TDL81997.1 16S rRNA processing protein RimM [Palleronia sediminis]